MDYRVARRQVVVRRFFGALITLVCSAFTIAGALFYAYRGMDKVAVGFSWLSNDVKSFVTFIFVHTQFLDFVWNHAAIPYPGTLSSTRTWALLGWYVGMFVGVSVIVSGNKLACYLRSLDRQIDNERTQISAEGGCVQPRVEFEKWVDIPNQPIWKQIYTLYIAPLLIGVILLALAKLIT